MAVHLCARVRNLRARYSICALAAVTCCAEVILGLGGHGGRRYGCAVIRESFRATRDSSNTSRGTFGLVSGWLVVHASFGAAVKQLRSNKSLEPTPVTKARFVERASGADQLHR